MADTETTNGRLSAPCLLNAGVVRSRLGELSIPQRELAKSLGIRPRTLSFWLARHPKRRPDLSQVERLAALIDLAPGDIATVDLDAVDEVVRAGGLPLSGEFFERFLGPQARKLWPQVIYYLRAIELQMTPLPGIVREFVHNGSHPNSFRDQDPPAGSFVGSDLRLLLSTR